MFIVNKADGGVLSRMGVSFELGWDSKRQGGYSSQGPNKKRSP